MTLGDEMTDWSTLAKTLAEIEAYEAEQAQVNHEAEAKRIKAAQLLREADELDGKT